MDSIGCGLLANLLADNVKFRIFWSTLGLVGALLVGAVIVSILDRWRKRTGVEGMSAGDQLAHFRDLRDRGTITQEEYERIRTRLASELRKEMNVPPPPAPTATAPPTQDVMTLRETPPPESPVSPQ